MSSPFVFQTSRQEDRAAPPLTDKLLEMAISSEMEGTRVWVRSDVLEPHFKQMASRVGRGEKDQVTKVGGLAFHRVDLGKLMSEVEEDRIFISLEGEYMEDGGLFNMSPLLLVGLSSKEGVSMTFGPSNPTIRAAYEQAMERCVSRLLNNVIATPTRRMEITAKKWVA